MPPSLKLADVERIVRNHYRPELWDAIRAGLAVIGSLAIQRRDHCLVLVYEGPSSTGKSIPVRVLSPDRPATEALLYRSDNFTPASFVSHAGDRKKEQLDEIDLLPKLRDKCLVTRELAPLFCEREETLRKSFGVLASVLDGDGYKSNSGTQGDRGYAGRYVFHWLGATTPVPPHAHRVMGNVGTRLLFFAVSAQQFSEDELMNFSRNYQGSAAVEECRKAANDFLEAYFSLHPVNSVSPDSITIAPEARRYLVRLAQLISCGRAPSRDYREGPQRALLLLQTMAQGLALIEDRSEVLPCDLALVRHVAFSSIPAERRAMLSALVTEQGQLDVSQVEALLGVTRPTARSFMQDLAALGLCEFKPGDPMTSTGARVILAEDFRWLLDGYPPESFSDEGQGAKEETCGV